MQNLLFDKAVLSIRDFSREAITTILEVASQFKIRRTSAYLQGKIIAQCFFEPSTRTRLSFETACLRLGGQNIGFSGADHLSIAKGETLYDTIKTVEHYADAIVLRHPREGAARFAAEISTKPVINAGDGANQHPTQALADLMTMAETQKSLDQLSIAFVGDLKYGRTVHSLIQACALFNARIYLVAPSLLSLPETYCEDLRQQSIRFSFHDTLDDVLPKVDILYMTRLQQERFAEGEFELRESPFVLQSKKLATVKPNLKILHPLPRGSEIPLAIDRTIYASYFQQVENAIVVRQALLALILNEVISFHSLCKY